MEPKKNPHIKPEAGTAKIPLQRLVRLFDSQLNRNYLVCFLAVFIAWLAEGFDSGFVKATIIFILAIPSGLFVGFGAMRWVEKGSKKHGM